MKTVKDRLRSLFPDAVVYSVKKGIHGILPIFDGLGPGLPAGVETIEREPTLEEPVSQMVTQSQCESPTYRKWLEIMKLDLNDPAKRYDRKTWEWVYILQALDYHGLLRPGSRGLGFGVGMEPLSAVMAARGCKITATDMKFDEAVKHGWANSNQHANDLAALNEAGICEPSKFLENTEYRVVDMNHIPADLKDYDFVWSSCSLEHLGSLQAGLRFIENSLACLKPGGVAVHTTEYNTSSNAFTAKSGGVVFYRKGDILRFGKKLRELGCKVRLNLTPGQGPYDKYIDVPPYRRIPSHIRLIAKFFVITSLGLVIEKPMQP